MFCILPECKSWLQIVHSCDIQSEVAEQDRPARGLPATTGRTRGGGEGREGREHHLTSPPVTSELEHYRIISPQRGGGDRRFTRTWLASASGLVVDGCHFWPDNWAVSAVQTPDSRLGPIPESVSVSQLTRTMQANMKLCLLSADIIISQRPLL